MQIAIAWAPEFYFRMNRGALTTSGARSLSAGRQGLFMLNLEGPALSLEGLALRREGFTQP